MLFIFKECIFHLVELNGSCAFTLVKIDKRSEILEGRKTGQDKGH